MPKLVAPSLNVTVPVGVTDPDVCVTVAVNVTDWPNTDGLSDEINVVVVPALLTAINGLVLVLAASALSVAVTELLLAVLRVTLNVCVPALNAASTGNVAARSDDVMRMASEIELRKFQFASTALTVTVKGTPSVSGVGVPVFPLSVPGAAASPGTSNCTFANAPALTAKLELATPATVPSVAASAVVSAFVSVVANVVVD